MFGEALGAITALQQESLAVGDTRQMLLQAARLACKNQRWERCELLFDVNQRLPVRIIRHLLDRLFAPTIGRPTLGHREYSKICAGLYTSSPGKGQIFAVALARALNGYSAAFRP